MRKIGRLVHSTFAAVGMLAILLIVLWFVLNLGSQAPVIGPAANWTAQHASGASYGL